MDDDILDILDNTATTKPVEDPLAGGAPSGDKKINLWEDDIDPLPVEADKLLRFNRMFTVSSSGAVPEDTNELIGKISAVLLENGFTYRHSGDSKDTLGIATHTAAKERAVVYLPWKTFNKDLEANMLKPTECGYRHAAYFHKGFTKIPPAVRAMVSRNTHLLLGDTCNTPVNLFICYTPDGAETIADSNYKTTGHTAYFIQVCEELSIPVFNLKKADAKDRIIAFIKSLT